VVERLKFELILVILNSSIELGSANIFRDYAFLEVSAQATGIAAKSFQASNFLT